MYQKADIQERLYTRKGSKRPDKNLGCYKVKSEDVRTNWVSVWVWIHIDSSQFTGFNSVVWICFNYENWRTGTILGNIAAAGLEERTEENRGK